jgi:hypothetical protein
MFSVALNSLITVPTSCWSSDRFIIFPPIRWKDFILAVELMVMCPCQGELQGNASSGCSNVIKQYQANLA